MTGKEKKLRRKRSNRKTPDLIASDELTDAVVVTDLDGTILALNKAAESLFGYTAAEAKGANCSVVIPSPFAKHHGSYMERFKHRLQQHGCVISEVVGEWRELPCQRKGGAVIPIAARLSVKDSKWLVVHAQDRSAQKVEELSLNERRCTEMFDETSTNLPGFLPPRDRTDPKFQCFEAKSRLNGNFFAVKKVMLHQKSLAMAEIAVNGIRDGQTTPNPDGSSGTLILPDHVLSSLRLVEKLVCMPAHAAVPRFYRAWIEQVPEVTFVEEGAAAPPISAAAPASRRRAASAPPVPVRCPSAAASSSPVAAARSSSDWQSCASLDFRGAVPEDFHLGTVLGKGAFSRVQLATYSGNGQQYAVKLIDLAAGSTAENRERRDDVLDRIRKEREIWFRIGSCASQYVVALHGAFLAASHAFFVMDFCAGGTLETLVDACGSLDEDMVLWYTAEMAQAVGALHSQGVVHRDIKPSNLLIDDKGHLKLADFGLSCLAEPSGRDCLTASGSGCAKRKGSTNQTQMTAMVGTPAFMAPEVWQGRSYGSAVDWYSVGATAFFCLTGRIPMQLALDSSLSSSAAPPPPPLPLSFDPNATDSAAALAWSQKLAGGGEHLHRKKGLTDVLLTEEDTSLSRASSLMSTVSASTRRLSQELDVMMERKGSTAAIMWLADASVSEGSDYEGEYEQAYPADIWEVETETETSVGTEQDDETRSFSFPFSMNSVECDIADRFKASWIAQLLPSTTSCSGRRSGVDFCVDSPELPPHLGGVRDTDLPWGSAGTPKVRKLLLGLLHRNPAYRFALYDVEKDPLIKIQMAERGAGDRSKRSPYFVPAPETSYAEPFSPRTKNAAQSTVLQSAPATPDKAHGRAGESVQSSTIISSIDIRVSLVVQMQLLPEQTLVDFLVKQKGGQPTRRQGLCPIAMFEQIVSGVAHLHANGITHGDVYPDNIRVEMVPGRCGGGGGVVDEDGSSKKPMLKLGDFMPHDCRQGLVQSPRSLTDSARVARSPFFAMYDNVGKGSRAQRALWNHYYGGCSKNTLNTEVEADGDGMADAQFNAAAAADVRALGLCLAELLAPLSVLRSFDSRLAHLKLHSKICPPNHPFRAELTQLVLSCTSSDPQKRPSAIQLHSQVLELLKVVQERPCPNCVAAHAEILHLRAQVAALQNQAGRRTLASPSPAQLGPERSASMPKLRSSGKPGHSLSLALKKSNSSRKEVDNLRKAQRCPFDLLK